MTCCKVPRSHVTSALQHVSKPHVTSFRLWVQLLQQQLLESGVSSSGLRSPALSSCSPATILQCSMQLQWITALRLYVFSWRPVLFALVTCLSYKSGERLQGKATVTATATGPKAHQQLQEGRGATVWGNCYAPELILACC